MRAVDERSIQRNRLIAIECTDNPVEPSVFSSQANFLGEILDLVRAEIVQVIGSGKVDVLVAIGLEVAE